MTSRAEQIEQETAGLRAFQRRADHIAHLVVATDLPWVDIDIQTSKLREEAARRFPEKTALFELIYVSRFRRLWAQWRPPPLAG